MPIKNSKEIDKNYLYYYLQYFNYDELLKGDVKVKGKEKAASLKSPISLKSMASDVGVRSSITDMIRMMFWGVR